MRTLNSTILKTAAMLKALGHPARVEIIRLIQASQTQSLSVTEIQRHLGITQPETSKHLVLLKNISVLSCERKNGHSYYKINEEYAFIRCILSHLKPR